MAWPSDLACAWERICSNIPKSLTVEAQHLIAEQAETCEGAWQRQQLYYWQKTHRKVWSPFAGHLRGGKEVLKENGGYVVGGCQPQRSFLWSAGADEQGCVIFLLLVFSDYPHQVGGSWKSCLQVLDLLSLPNMQSFYQLSKHTLFTSRVIFMWPVSIAAPYVSPPLQQEMSESTCEHLLLATQLPVYILYISPYTHPVWIWF